ncbi:EAL domain-containing protein [Acidovorax sp. PRC11]|nr:EAL domain-containing protein [Acidovorax sp. PRC11]MDT0136887.1 EAL domain-containing protein [Acidovorax sp. PRC11]
MAIDTGLLLWIHVALVAALALVPARRLAATPPDRRLQIGSGLVAGAASCLSLWAGPSADAVPTAIAAACLGPLAGALSGLVAAVGEAALRPDTAGAGAGLLASAWAMGCAWGALRRLRGPGPGWVAVTGLAATLALAARAWSGAPSWPTLAGALVLGGGALLVIARARTTDALLRRQADLQAMLEATAGGRWEWTLHEDRLACHGRFYEAFGIEAHGTEASALRWTALMHPDDAERVSGQLHQARQSREDMFSAEYRVRDTRGRWRWILSRGQVAERDAHGRVLRATGVHLDVTPARDEQEAARRVHEQQSVLYQMLPDAAAITGVDDGLCIDVNPAFTTMFGITREQAFGRTTLDIGVWACAAERERMMELLRRQGHVEKMPATLLSGTRTITGLFSARKMRVGDRDCLVSIFQDTSETQLAHDQLAAAHGLLLQAGHMAGLGVWEHGRGTGLVYWSDACFGIHGVPRGSRLPGPSEYLDRFVVEPFRAPLDGYMRHGLETASGWSMELQVQRADDGRAVWVRIHAEPVLRDGAATGMRGIIQDIDGWRRAAERLTQSEDRFMHLFELMPYPVLMSERANGTYLVVNKAWERLTGIPREQAIGRTAIELGIFTPEDRRRLLHDMSGRSVHNGLEIAVHTRNGGTRTLLQSMHAAELDGVPVWLVSAYDITERKRGEDLVREREALLSLTLSAASLGLWDWSLATGMVAGDARWRELHGLPEAQDAVAADGIHWTRGMAPADIESVAQELERHLAGPEPHFDATWYVEPAAPAFPASPPGALADPPAAAGRWVRHLGKVVDRDAGGRPLRMLGVAMDVTSQRAQEDLLHRLAHFDTLTGLPNRVHLAGRLEQAMAAAQQDGRLLGVAYLDLDGFKPVNDRLGHSAGDRLLVIVAGRLVRALRPMDCVARLGGDEFVILLPGLRNRADAEELLQRLMDNLSAPFTLGTEHAVVTASVGYTLYPEDGADADTLLRHADHAMYGAKQAGRNRVQAFDAAQERARQACADQARQLRGALAYGQFELYLQPKVDMRSGAVVGAEALARWRHPDRGLLAPAAFLPLIEQAELETAFGEWAVDSALGLIEMLRSRGVELPVSVNISARHLQQQDFAQWVAGRIALRPGMPAQLLDLEITESAALYDMDHVVPQLLQLRRLGATVSLDDFGTGYSSLSYLRRLPMDTLKLDRSFVSGMMTDPGDFAIVKGVIGLADSFGYSIVAEGVETEAQGAALLDLGCTLAQGYRISRPMAAEEFPGWASAWRAPDGWRRPIRSGPSPAAAPKDPPWW